MSAPEIFLVSPRWMPTREDKHVEVQQNLQPVMISFHPSKPCTMVIHNIIWWHPKHFWLLSWLVPIKTQEWIRSVAPFHTFP